MEKPDAQRVKRALIEAGLEIYRTADTEIQVAERVRLHIMDSGIRVMVSDQLAVTFTARSQKSDFPAAEADTLFEKVRGSVGSQASPRGYIEKNAATVEVKDPVDAAKVLDVWHEVTYEKETPDVESIVDEVRWALEVDKYVTSGEA